MKKLKALTLHLALIAIVGSIFFTAGAAFAVCPDGIEQTTERDTPLATWTQGPRKQAWDRVARPQRDARSIRDMVALMCVLSWRRARHWKHTPNTPIRLNI